MFADTFNEGSDLGPGRRLRGGMSLMRDRWGDRG